MYTTKELKQNSNTNVIRIHFMRFSLKLLFLTNKNKINNIIKDIKNIKLFNIFTIFRFNINSITINAIIIFVKVI